MSRRSYRQRRLKSSAAYFYPPVLNHHFVSFNCAAVSQAFACPQIEAPAVPTALDCVLADVTVCERRALVWTEIFDGVKLAVEIVERQFCPGGKINGCGAT